MPVTEGPDFRGELIAAGVLVPTASDGIYGRSSVYEDIVAGIERIDGDCLSSEGAISYRFPPVMPRRVLEQSGYLSSFPDMIGTVSTFQGDNKDHKKLMDARAVRWRMDRPPPGRRRQPVSRCLPSALSDPDRARLPEGGSRYDVVGLVLPSRAESRPGPDAVVPPARLGLCGRGRPGQRSTATVGCSSAPEILTRSG